MRRTSPVVTDGPVRDRAAIAESQQSGAEAQPDRAREVAVALGVVGRALQRVGILVDSGDATRRASPSVATRRTRRAGARTIDPDDRPR